jgi:NADPH:quinone reductase-like Zn-dependent oxidoreductase
MGNAAEYGEVVRRLGQGQLRPIVDRVYPLEQARDAYERLATGAQFGKVVVELPSGL